VSEPTIYTIDQPPPDWVYEPSDTSVGIFSEGWYHALEDCADEALNPEEHVVSERFEGDGANRKLISVLGYRCPCGAAMTIAETTYDPDMPEDFDDAWGL
jgi:hypothetical protein